MNNSELDEKLKAARVPARAEGYWETFPRRITRELRAIPSGRTVGRSSPPWLAWGASAAFGCLIAVFCLGHSRMPREIARALLTDEREIRLELVQLPQRLRTFMRDEHGLGSLIAD